MAYSEELAQRIRDEIGDHPALVEKQMFGGIAYMVLADGAMEHRP